mgnify:CR=1 FL=1
MNLKDLLRIIPGYTLIYLVGSSGTIYAEDVKAKLVDYKFHECIVDYMEVTGEGELFIIIIDEFMAKS